MPRKIATFTLWCGIAALCFLGIASAVNRGVDVVATLSAGERGAPTALDRRTFEGLARIFELKPGTAPYGKLEAEMVAMSAKYHDHPLITLLHVVPGALVLLLAPLQFSATLRTRYVRIHRWSGRILLAAAALTGVTGLFLGLVVPYGGFAESSAAAVFGGFFLFAAAQAYASIRRRDVVRHREWMIRLFAGAVGIAVIRLVGVATIAILRDPELILPRNAGFSLWIGWALALTAAELWIRRTRPQRRAERMSVPEVESHPKEA